MEQRSGRELLAEATVKVEVAGEILHTAADGNGPVNALDGALRKALRAFYPVLDAVHLVDYKVRILDGATATAARTRVIIDSQDGSRTWSTMGSDTNIIAASAQALADSLEYAIWKSGRRARPTRRAPLHDHQRHASPAMTGMAPNERRRRGPQVRLDRWTVTAGSNVNSRAAVVIRAGGHDWKASAEGTGAIDALYKAVDAALADVLGGHPLLVAYDVHALARGAGRGGPGDGPDRAARSRAGRPSGRAGSPARSPRHEHDRGVGRGVRRGAQRDARRRVVGGRRRGGRVGRGRPTAATSSAADVGRAEFDDEAEPHRHDGVVQPLGGSDRALARCHAPDAEAFNRFEAAGWEARADSYAFLQPDHPPGGRDAAGRGRGQARAAGARRRVRPGRPRRRGRGARRGHRGHRRRPVDGPPGRDRAPVDPVPGRLVRGDPGRRRGVRRGARQLRAQPRRPAGRRARARRTACCGPAAGWRCRPGMRRAATGSSACCSTPSRPPTPRRPPGLPPGPTNFRSDDELRDAVPAAQASRTSGSATSCSRRAVPDTETLWRGVLDSAVRIPPLVLLQPPDVQARIRARVRGAGRRPPASGRHARDPGLGPGHARAAASEHHPRRLHGRARRLRRGGRAALLRGARGRAPVLVPGRVRGGRDGAVQAGVVPVESSLLGTIRENLDLLWEFDLPVVGRGVGARSGWRCSRCPGETLETIERVYSIAAALAQADEFLRSRPWTIQTTYNTAGAAKQVAERGERGAAAVASARVAPIYGLEVLADDIQTGDDNRTRFAVIARAGRGSRGRAWRRRGPRRSPGPPRTSLVFAVRNVPGVALPVAGRLRDPRAQPVATRVPAVDGPRDRAGSTCSGWISTPTPPTRSAPRRWTSCAVRPSWSGSWAPTRGRPRTEGRTSGARSKPAVPASPASQAAIIGASRGRSAGILRADGSLGSSQVDEAFRAEMAAGYTFDEPVIVLGSPMHGRRGAARRPRRSSPLSRVNRHGLIAGATGTGKTKTLQLLAGQLSAAGVPGVRGRREGRPVGRRRARRPGEPQRRRALPSRSAGPSRPQGHPVELLSLSGKRGAHVRASVSLLRAAAPGQGPRPQRHPDQHPVARLPLLRRRAPAAAGPRRPAHDAQVPRLRRGQADPRGPRRHQPARRWA